MADQVNPLSEVAVKVGGVWAGVHAILGAVAMFGLLSASQVNAVNGVGESLSPMIISVGTILGAIIPLFSGLVAAFTTAKVGKDKVTPVESPQDNYGVRLVPVLSDGTV